MAGAFTHMELYSKNVKQVKSFYRAMFQWKLKDIPAMEYTMITAGNGIGGGLARTQKAKDPSHWVPYVAVVNVDASVKKAKKLGAKVLMPAMDVAGPNIRICIIADPAGAPCGLLQSL
jgi:hypothetical protein